MGVDNFQAIMKELMDIFIKTSRSTSIESFKNSIIKMLKMQERPLDSIIGTYAAAVFVISSAYGTDISAIIISESLKLIRKLIKKNGEISNISFFISHLFLFDVIGYKGYNEILLSYVKKIRKQKKSKRKETLIEIILILLKKGGAHFRKGDHQTELEKIHETILKLDIKDMNPRELFLISAFDDLYTCKKRIIKDDPDVCKPLRVHINQFLARNNIQRMVPLNFKEEDLLSNSLSIKWKIIGQGQSKINNENIKIIKNKSEDDQIAKAYGISGKLRISIFNAIVKSNGYLDAISNLKKLKLREIEMREIPKIIIFCAEKEERVNPFYSKISCQIVKEKKFHAITFTYIMWDNFREAENKKVKEISNITSIYAALIREKLIKLSSIKGFDLSKIEIKKKQELFLALILCEYFTDLSFCPKKEFNSIKKSLNSIKKGLIYFLPKLKHFSSFLNLEDSKVKIIERNVKNLMIELVKN